MKSHQPEKVFGVSREPLLSFVDREAVDKAFVEALRSDNQIVVYGASKQGKTSLVKRHLKDDQYVRPTFARL